MGIDHLRIEKQLPNFETNEFEMTLECSAFDTFIAKQIDQSTKYYLLQLHEFMV